MIIRKPKRWDGDPNTWSGKFYIPLDFPFTPRRLEEIRKKKNKPNLLVRKGRLYYVRA